MICDAILGNVSTPGASAEEAAPVDVVEFHWEEATRRFLRKRSRGGRDVSLLLPVGTVLRHGDVLRRDPTLIVYAELLPVRLIVVRPGRPRDWARLAYELASRHQVMQIGEGSLRMPEDDVLAAWLQRMGVAFEVIEGRFEPYAVESLQWATPRTR